MNKKYNYRLLVSYDGTHYGGWQVQPNAPSIQQRLQEALFVITKEEISVIGSGRTDAGVHAHAQVANFYSDTVLDSQRLRTSLNGLLPFDIRVVSVEPVPVDFHSRFSAKRKCYHYHLYLDPVLSPFKRSHVWHVRQSFNLKLLKEAANLFVGEHDFTSFANEAHSGSAAHNAVRRLYRLDVVEEPGGLRLEFEGDGFLYKMVRNIVGTLHEVAIGKMDVNEIPKIFEAKDRRQAGQAAPPQGLFLASVTYGS
jgi:tRNA pseudouridine38-40 synthase